VRAELRLPHWLYVALSSYLLFAIGLKGGAALAASSPASASGPLLIALVLGCLVPVWAYAVARRLGRFGIDDAAALAAHYGSVSVVTFTASMAFLGSLDVEVEGYMVAILALLEAPGILVALFIASRASGNTSWHRALGEVVRGRSIALLLAGLVLGAVAGNGGMAPLAPIFVTPFYLVLVVFLLEMGRVASSHLGAIRESGRFLLAFGILMPLFNGTLGVAAGTLVGLSVGGATILGTIAASASYIAAPAAVRHALPRARPGIPLAASLGVTFPFNLVAGIPLYYQLARLLG
jgi:hypothetical protein